MKTRFTALFQKVPENVRGQLTCTFAFSLTALLEKGKERNKEEGMKVRQLEEKEASEMKMNRV